MRKLMAAALAAIMIIGCGFSAFAADNPEGQTIEDNTGTIETNNGTIMRNCTPNGTVNTNNGTIFNNYQNVGTNNGTVKRNYLGTVTTNAADGTVTTNEYGGIVVTNNGTVTTNAADGTVVTNNGTVTTNAANGIVITNGSGGTVETNNGTVVTNSGTVVTNSGVVTTNIGTVTTNNGILSENQAGGTVVTNSSEISANSGTVVTNSSYVVVNLGTVEENNGEILANIGTVKENTFIGTVIMGSDAGEIDENYGIVNYAKLDNGRIVYDPNCGTVCAITYGETPEALAVYKNEQQELAAVYTVRTAAEAGASRVGYTFLNWRVNTSSRTIQLTTCVGGETITIDAPVWFEAVWERIQEEAGSLPVGGGSSWTLIPISYGSASAPVSNGVWSQTAAGKWQYRINGEMIRNAVAWITFTNAQGQTVTGKYCFDSSGSMITDAWKEVQNGVWNYFGSDGRMLVNTATPDGYAVDANGEYRK